MAERNKQVSLTCDFANELQYAAIHGGITPILVLATERKYKQLGLIDLKRARRQLYQSVFSHFANDNEISASEKQQLTHLRHSLDLSDIDLGDLDVEMARLEWLSRLKRGQLTPIQVPVVLQKNEVAYLWLDDVGFYQERVVGRRYEGGSQGFSIRICKGVSYRVGSHRGELVMDREIVYLDTGVLCLTSKRLLFSGASKSFSIQLAKILNVTPFIDGISVTKDSTAESNRPFYFMTWEVEALMLTIMAIANS